MKVFSVVKKEIIDTGLPMEKWGSRATGMPDLQFSGPRFNSRASCLLELFLGSPEFNSSPALGNSQLVCLVRVGIFNLFC